MTLFGKLQEKRHAERIRKSERMQGFTMQAELSTTVVRVTLLESGVEKTKFLVEYADGTKKEEEAENQSIRFAELMQYLG